MSTEVETRIVKGESLVISHEIELLNRVLAILDAMEGQQPRTLTDIVTSTHLSKSTCHRLLQAMERHHLVRKEGRYYSLGCRLFSYVYSHIMSQPVATIARPILRQLRTDTGLTVALAVRQGAFRVVIAIEESDQGPHRFVDVGQVAVIYAGSGSKILMAWLTKEERDEILAGIRWERITDRTISSRLEFEKECRRIRERGWAVSFGEREPTAFSISVPVLNVANVVTSALMITGPLGSYKKYELNNWLDSLTGAGADISHKLGYRGTYPPSIRCCTEKARTGGPL